MFSRCVAKVLLVPDLIKWGIGIIIGAAQMFTWGHVQLTFESDSEANTFHDDFTRHCLHTSPRMRGDHHSGTNSTYKGQALVPNIDLL
jgi:hypothetical protein